MGLYPVTIWQSTSIGVLLSLLSAAAPVAAQSPTPAVDVIVERMARARADNRASFRAYVVTREYALFEEETTNPKSEVTASVSFRPPNAKQYSILKRSGSGLGERLVRRMLDGETTIVKENGQTDLTPNNYEFRFSGEESIGGRRCYVLEMLPRRKDKTLLRGTVWVDAGTYLLHRMQGEPAKSPSWWLRDTHITFFYGDVQGMWLQTASEFNTRVRVFGEHRMVARDVNYDTGSGPVSAKLRAPTSDSIQKWGDIE